MHDTHQPLTITTTGLQLHSVIKYSKNIVPPEHFFLNIAALVDPGGDSDDSIKHAGEQGGRGAGGSWSEDVAAR